MSTHVYLECLDHEAAPRSDEVGHNLGDLKEIRESIRRRENTVKLIKLADELDVDLDHWNARYLRTIRFFKEHPTCSLGIVDEYGRRHPLEEYSPAVQAVREAEVQKMINFIENALGFELYDYQKEWIWRIYEDKERRT